MNWSPPCSAAQVAGGICTYLCPTGDCATPRNGDDPASKFRQAKEALYEVVRDITTEIHYGWATYNQDRLGVLYKQWLYRVNAVQTNGFIALDSGALFRPRTPRRCSARPSPATRVPATPRSAATPPATTPPTPATSGR